MTIGELARSLSPDEFRDHVAVEHDPATCPTVQDGRSCMFCDGGLFACEACGSFEGATTSSCPGVRMTPEREDEVYRGEIDFRNGRWVQETSPYSPAYYRRYQVDG